MVADVSNRHGFLACRGALQWGSDVEWKRVVILMSVHVWLAFLATTLIFSLSPGAGAVNTISTAMRHGWRGTLPAIAGLQLGMLCHLALVGAGLGTLLAQSSEAFTLLKWGGAAYLIWLGWQKWRAPARFELANGGERAEALFWPAVLVNLTNPKTILFLVALFPQFLHTDYPLWSQTLILGLTCVLVDCLVMVGYALVASPLAQLVTNERRMRLQNRLFGSLFMAAGAALASSSR